VPKGKPKPGERKWQKTNAATRKRTKLAEDFAKQMAPVLLQAQRERVVLKNQIAAWLNDNGYTTRRGKAWSRVAVQRLFSRLKVMHDAGWRAE
jgi:hypothetical protein